MLSRLLVVACILALVIIIYLGVTAPSLLDSDDIKPTPTPTLVDGEVQYAL